MKTPAKAIAIAEEVKIEDLNDKVTGGSLSATEWNQVPSEIQNVIENTGQVLAGGDLNQLGKGIAGYVANGDFYTDTGAADAHVLGVIGIKQAPASYADGFRAIFRAGNSNTGAATVNVATLGVKNIFYNGAALVGGEIASGDIISIVYDNASGRFDLVSVPTPLLKSPIATTSGTSHDYTSIPSWVKRITVIFNGVSTNSTSQIIVQLGDSGGFETTGYTGTISSITAAAASALLSSGFNLYSIEAATYVHNGSITLTLQDPASNTWAATGMIGHSDSAAIGLVAGIKSLSAALTQIRLTTEGGTAVFDAGTFNVTYE